MKIPLYCKNGVQEKSGMCYQCENANGQNLRLQKSQFKQNKSSTKQNGRPKESQKIGWSRADWKRILQGVPRFV